MNSVVGTISPDQGRGRIKKMLPSMSDKPANLYKTLLNNLADDEFGAVVEKDWPVLEKLILSSDPNEVARLHFGDLLRKWDNARDMEWVGHTKRNTQERRDLIYRLLGVDLRLQARISGTLPFCTVPEPLVVSDEYPDWYKPEAIGEDSPTGFYWRAYKRYLRGKGWPDQSLTALDNSTREIISRLANPGDPGRGRRVRGLVVGYVQSGKTANFTGVISKAIDAGYRLVIVLAGTWNMLREQTQRRLDKELVGKPTLCEYEDYQIPPEDWGDFNDHGIPPESLEAPKLERLTGANDDYKRLKQAIGALDYQRHDLTKPFNHYDNLKKAPCRIIVIKKIPIILKKLCGDLNRIRDRLQSVPSLIIDDESDQAGVNTLKPPKQGERKKRNATNREIVRLLEILSFGQYVGYTATPYANYLIDKEDAADLFPRDFILPLDRPPGYMGISDFFDPELYSDEIPENDFTFKERAFVRDAHDSERMEYRDSMKAALASYVMAGAVKLFRQSLDSESKQRFRHHTMLVHSSRKTVQHSDDLENVKNIFSESSFSGPGTKTYLRDLWENDFLPVMSAQGADGPIPKDFETLYCFVGPALDKITQGQTVRVLNAAGDGDAPPDFDRQEVWEIIVGGDKLSRGYTIEGLTISYYLRRAGAADTLMQMGRWYGFRHGYRDLVRIFVGRSQGAEGIDLVDLFKQACDMEERARDDIRRYRRKADGAVLRPIDIPPLIAISGNLPPTSKNKRWNSEITSKNYGDKWVMPTRMPHIERVAKTNLLTAENLWAAAKIIGTKKIGGQFEGGDHEIFDAVLREAGKPQLIHFLVQLKWFEDTPPTDFELVLEFLNKPDNGITSCLLIAPQLQQVKFPESWQGLTIKERKRMGGDRGPFGGFGEPVHRKVAEFLTGRSVRMEAKNPLQEPTPETVQYRDEQRMIVLIYPVRAKLPRGGHESFVTFGFELLFPRNNMRPGIEMRTRVPNNNPVVEI